MHEIKIRFRGRVLVCGQPVPNASLVQEGPYARRMAAPARIPKWTGRELPA